MTLRPMSTSLSTSLDATVYNGQITVGHDSKYAVVTGSWIVKRYIDTDHPEVTVLSDKEFRRKYQASIEAA